MATTAHERTGLRLCGVAAAAFLATGCTPLKPSATGPVPQVPASFGVPASTAASPYLDLLVGLGPGDASRQSTDFESIRRDWQAAPTPRNTLRYALMLGTPGHLESNPAEASRLLARLLDAPDGLAAEEVKLARVFLREFDARLTLYADLARERELWDGRLRAAESTARAQGAAQAAETNRLRRERDTLKEKLDAIAEIERSLMERDTEAVPPPDVPE